MLLTTARLFVAAIIILPLQAHTAQVSHGQNFDIILYKIEVYFPIFSLFFKKIKSPIFARMNQFEENRYIDQDSVLFVKEINARNRLNFLFN